MKVVKFSLPSLNKVRRREKSSLCNESVKASWNAIHRWLRWSYRSTFCMVKTLQKLASSDIGNKAFSPKILNLTPSYYALEIPFVCVNQAPIDQLIEVGIHHLLQYFTFFLLNKSFSYPQVNQPSTSKRIILRKFAEVKETTLKMEISLL